MPCKDGREDQWAREDKAYLDKLTRMLCESCKLGTPTTEAWAWYGRHCQEDKLREERERRAATDSAAAPRPAQP